MTRRLAIGIVSDVGPHAGHDTHFLQRVERLNGEHAELALGLYYDRELVRYIVSQAELPDDATRVAI